MLLNVGAVVNGWSTYVADLIEQRHWRVAINLPLRPRNASALVNRMSAYLNIGKSLLWLRPF